MLIEKNSSEIMVLNEMHNVIKLDSWLFYPWQFPASSTQGIAPLPIVLRNINVGIEGGDGPLDTKSIFIIFLKNISIKRTFEFHDIKTYDMIYFVFYNNNAF